MRRSSLETAFNGPTIIGVVAVPYTIGTCLLYIHCFQLPHYVAIPLAIGTTVVSYTALAAAVMLIPPRRKDT